MREVGIDISDRTPQEITFEELQNSEYVITMGCSANDVCPAGWGGESRDGVSTIRMVSPRRWSPRYVTRSNGASVSCSTNWNQESKRPGSEVVIPFAVPALSLSQFLSDSRPSQTKNNW